MKNKAIQFDEDKEYENYLKSVNTIRECLFINSINYETAIMIFIQLIIEKLAKDDTKTVDDVKNQIIEMATIFLYKTDLYLSIQKQK